MRVVRLIQVGLWVAIAAGAGIGCSEDGTPPVSDATSELKPVRRVRPEAVVKQTNLVADQKGFARKTDPDLLNAWGIAFKGRSIWIAANHTGTDRQYSEDGRLGEVISLFQTDGTTPASPTGQVINPFSSAFGGEVFIVASEDGDIFGVTPGTSPGTIHVPNEGAAVYKGVAIATFKGQPRIYATDFHNRKIDVFGPDFAPVTPGGDFVDPQLATLTEDGATPNEMYAPFNIQAMGDLLLVTYALQLGPENGDDDAGPGRGFVDIFDTDGHFKQRLISRGQLNSPWGLALAPESDDDVDLMVGNFGNGHINVYNPVTGRHLGQLRRPNGKPIVIDGLWALMFGNGNAAKTNQLIFSAGPNDESHGLLGKILVNH